MTPEEIDAALAKDVEGRFPKTIADALTLVFGSDDSFRGMVDRAPGVGDTATVTFEVKFTMPMEVAKAHLRRLQKIEDRGEPQDHLLFQGRR